LNSLVEGKPEASMPLEEIVGNQAERSSTMLPRLGITHSFGIACLHLVAASQAENWRRQLREF
jgi:hypothetical protein